MSNKNGFHNFSSDEALIKSEITLKYYDNFDSKSGSTESLSGSGCKFNGKNLMTYFKQKTGRKLLQDEAIGKYRDEHSSPFSVKTRSQLNLRTFEDEEEQCGPSEDYNKILSHKLAQEAARRAAILSPMNKAKEASAAAAAAATATATITEPIDTNISYNKIKNETEDADGNFISKFINRLSTTNGNHYVPEETDEQENLVNNINLSLSTQHSEDSEDDLHHTEKSMEFKSLLSNTDGFDFLNNW